MPGLAYHHHVRRQLAIAAPAPSARSTGSPRALRLPRRETRRCGLIRALDIILLTSITLRRRDGIDAYTALFFSNIYYALRRRRSITQLTAFTAHTSTHYYYCRILRRRRGKILCRDGALTRHSAHDRSYSIT